MRQRKNDPMKHIISMLIGLLLVTSTAEAQHFNGIVKDTEGNKLARVSVVLLDKKNLILSYTITKDNGAFSVDVPEGKEATKIKFSSVGYATDTIAVSDFKNNQVVVMNPGVTMIKEVKVQARAIKQRGDTIDYLVSSFKKEQDRSIADVIARMAGMEVKKDGTILYQGKAINKFYVEGMDMMGGKYSMISENLTPDKVRKVQVFENHQPIKTLKNVDFSENAALNIVLKEDAKNVWQTLFEAGSGITLQDDAKALFDIRLLGMLFSKKKQSLSMYKFNNTGKDIRHEMTTHSIFEGQVRTEYSLLSDISLGGSSLDDNRTLFNNTHLLANNWLFKLNDDCELRTQVSTQFDKTTAESYSHTVYTSLIGDSVIAQQRDARRYNSEYTGELLFRYNNDKLYLNNTLNGYMDFDRSMSHTLLNGTTKAEKVKPRQRYLTDKLRLIKNINNKKSFELDAYFSYNYLPGTLLISNGSVEELNLRTVMWGASTNFRHPLWGLDVCYRIETEGKSQKLQVNNFMVNDEDSFTEQKLTVEPSVTYFTPALNISAFIPLNLRYQSFNGKQQTKLKAEPGISLRFTPFNRWTFMTFYNLSWTPSDIRMTSMMPFFSDYIVMRRGYGKPVYQKYQTLNGSVEYKDIFHKLFARMQAYFSRSDNNILYRSAINPEFFFYQSEPTDRFTFNKSFSINASLSKNFDWLKSGVTLSARKGTTKTELLYGEELQPIRLDNGGISLSCSVDPVAWLSVDAASNFNYTKQKNEYRTGTPSPTLTYFNHSLRASLTFGKWLIQTRNELYHSNNESVSTTFFSDLKVRYSRKKIEIALALNNIFGKNKFERRVVTETTNAYYMQKLRPREVLLSFAYGI